MGGRERERGVGGRERERGGRGREGEGEGEGEGEREIERETFRFDISCHVDEYGVYIPARWDHSHLPTLLHDLSYSVYVVH